jgi:hypothetical protein
MNPMRPIVILGAVLVCSPLAAQESKPQAPRRPPRLEAPFDATPQVAVERMLKLARAGPGDLVCDLGCGDARFPVTAALIFGSRGLGVDLDPARVADSLANVKKNNVADKVVIKEGDIFEEDLSTVDVLTLYLLPRMLQRLRPQLEKLPVGARVVTYVFPIAGLRSHKVESVTSERGTYSIYLYTVPLQPDFADPWYTPGERLARLLAEEPPRLAVLAGFLLYGVVCAVRFSRTRAGQGEERHSSGRGEVRFAIVFWTFVPPIVFLLDLYVFHRPEARAHVGESQVVLRLAWLATLAMVLVLSRSAGRDSSAARSATMPAEPTRSTP